MHPIDKLVEKLDEHIRLYKEERAKARAAAGCANDSSSLLDDSPTDPVENDNDVDEDVADIVTNGTIGDVARLVNSIALNSGWWNKHEEAGFATTVNGAAEKLLMIHAEVSEAVEDLRVALTNEDLVTIVGCGTVDGLKPSGFATELADIIIRTLDLAEWLGIDIEDALIKKISFNQTRSFRHGNRNL